MSRLSDEVSVDINSESAMLATSVFG